MHLWVHGRINGHCLFTHRIFLEGPMKFDIVRCEQCTGLLKLCVRAGFGIAMSAIRLAVWACMAEKR